jgi:uncharacterized repeat protein (TIGR01451 family)/CSLREA domain-containing protein
MMPRAHLLIPLLLAALAGCRDATDPPVGPRPQFAQGDNGTWTVNSLADPGDGVCDDAECTLREAIAAAASGDKIVFGGGLQGDIDLTAGQLEIVDKNLTIDGAGRIALDAQGSSRVMQVRRENVVTVVTLDGLTFKNGFADEESGGGLVFFHADVTLRNSLVSANVADGEGGGIYNVSISKLTLVNSTLDGNKAGSQGGGISNYAELAVIGSTISGNDGPSGGGGILNRVGATATVARSTISGNRGADGAGIANYGGTMALRSVTLTGNAATSGIGGHAGSGSTTVANSIIGGNSGGFASDCNGNEKSLGHNLTTGCLFTPTGAPGDVKVTLAQLFTEVLEADLKDNGGPTKTHALIPRGRAADAGYCPGETTDQRGLARPVDDPVMPNALDACDIGPYELQGPVAAVADLMISQAVNKTSVKQGDLLTYSIRVQNRGPETAPSVVVSDLLPSGTTFIEAKHNKGTHTAPPKGETGTVTWSVGDLLDQANEVAEITVTVLVKGRTTITNTASVTGGVADPNEANNSAAITVSVASGAGGKGGGKK